MEVIFDIGIRLGYKRINRLKNRKRNCTARGFGYHLGGIFKSTIFSFKQASVRDEFFTFNCIIQRIKCFHCNPYGAYHCFIRYTCIIMTIMLKYYLINYYVPILETIFAKCMKI